MTHHHLDSAYATLGLRPNASAAVVKRQYRALVRKWHPDRFTGDPQAIAEATLMLKAVNHAYSTILENRSPQAFTPQPHTEPARVSHPVDGKLTQAEIDEIVAALRHAESLQTVLFAGDVAGWRSRALSSAVAAIYVASAWNAGQVIRMLPFCLICLLLIWFPDVLGERIGGRITKPSPPILVWFLGWVVLFLPIIALGISWWMTP